MKTPIVHSPGVTGHRCCRNGVGRSGGTRTHNAGFLRPVSLANWSTDPYF